MSFRSSVSTYAQVGFALVAVVSATACVGKSTPDDDDDTPFSDSSASECPGQLTVPISSVDFVTGEPTPGVEVRFLTSHWWAPEGWHESQELITTVTTNESGTAEVSLDACSIVDWMAITDSGLTRGAPLQVSIAPSPRTVYTVPGRSQDEWLTAVGVTLDPDSAGFIGQVLDEAGVPAPNREVTAWENLGVATGTVYYFNAGLPSIDANATDDSGLWFAVLPHPRYNMPVWFTVAGYGGMTFALWPSEATGAVVLEDGVSRPDQDSACENC